MVATKPVDFRKGMEGLATLVREHMKADPFSGAVYVFRAKRDGTGPCVVACAGSSCEGTKWRFPASGFPAGFTARHATGHSGQAAGRNFFHPFIARPTAS